MNYRIAVALLTALLACGDKKKQSTKIKDDAAAGPTVAPIAMPSIGIDSVKRINFPYGDGMREGGKVPAELGKSNWSAVKQHSEAALAKDANHLDAHYWLALALAQAGEHAAAVDHLVTALSADYFEYAPKIQKEPVLKPLLATQHGTALTELGEKIRGEYLKKIATGVLVVARRSSFKYPKDKETGLTSRGELYAFDRETRRYFRITHTGHQVAAVVRAPSGAEVAVYGFDRFERPKSDDAPPLIARGWVRVFDTKTWEAVTPKVEVGGGREVHVGYGAGDQLLVATAPANGRWSIGEVAIQSLDKSTGKLTKVKAELPLPRVAFSLEEGRTMRNPEHVKVVWSGEPPTTPTIAVEGGTQIRVPESGQAAQATIAVAPDKSRVAFATHVDPCAKDASPSLYVADAKTGTLKHLLTSKSRFVTRWIDPTTLAYEDGDGAVRIWDATTGREAMKLENKVGIALDVLSVAPAPLCKGAPPTVDVGSGSADEPPPLPPEEGSGSDAPVTKPQ